MTIVAYESEIDGIKIPQKGRVKVLAKILEKKIDPNSISNIIFLDQNYWMQREIKLYNQRKKAQKVNN